MNTYLLLIFVIWREARWNYWVNIVRPPEISTSKKALELYKKYFSSLDCVRTTRRDTRRGTKSIWNLVCEVKVHTIAVHTQILSEDIFGKY